jgi:mono/diheme cytochrome c family protein
MMSACRNVALISLILCSSTQLFAAPRLAEQENLTSSQKEGRRVFQQKCAVCHVPAWPSATALGPGLSNQIIQGPGNESAARDAITNGLYDQSGLGAGFTMPGWKYTLSSEQIDNVIDYLKSLAQPPQTVASEHPER